MPLQRPAQPIEKVVPLGRGEFSNEDGCVSGRLISSLLMLCLLCWGACRRGPRAWPGLESFQQPSRPKGAVQILTWSVGCC